MNSQIPNRAPSQTLQHLPTNHDKHLYRPIPLLAISLLILGLVFFTGCAPQSTPGPTPQTQDTNTHRVAIDSQPQVTEITHCNHPRFADTIVTHTCTEAFGCGITAQSLTQRNAIRFRVRSDCGGSPNYNFNGKPIQYGIYSLTSISGNHYHFHLMKKFTCMANPMTIASNQFQDNRLYLIRMIEDLTTVMDPDVSVPIGSNVYGWVFRTGKYKGSPCGIQ